MSAVRAALLALGMALAMQRALDVAWAAAGDSDPYGFDELAALHAARGDADRAAYFRALAGKGR